MRKITEQRREYWARVIGDQEASGETVRGYCRSRKVGEHSFYQWRRRLEEQGRKTKPERPVQFVPVDRQTVIAGPERGGVELTLVSGDRLHVPAGADADTLRMILAVLGEAR
ncbi:MAG: hypothetical protein R2729_28505 [Bryobacteraceae bacterium]